MNRQPSTPRSPLQDHRRLRRALLTMGVAVAMLWAVLLADRLLGLELVRWGIYPRTALGLPGVLWAPFIHGSWSHAFANTLPLLVLGTAVLYAYPRAAVVALPTIYLGAGLGVWLMARASFHIGASGVTHGLMFFLFIIGILRRDKRSSALAMLVFFLYGGMVWSIFPRDPDISFESHFFGALIGAVLAFALRRRDPLPAVRRYDWEDEDAEAADACSDERWAPDPDSDSDQRKPPLH